MMRSLQEVNNLNVTHGPTFPFAHFPLARVNITGQLYSTGHSPRWTPTHFPLDHHQVGGDGTLPHPLLDIHDFP